MIINILILIFCIVIFIVIYKIFYTKESLNIAKDRIAMLDNMLQEPGFEQVKNNIDSLVKISLQEFELYKTIQKPLEDLDKKQSELYVNLRANLNKLEKDKRITKNQYVSFVFLPYYKGKLEERRIPNDNTNDKHIIYGENWHNMSKMLDMIRRDKHMVTNFDKCEMNIPYEKPTNYKTLD